VISARRALSLLLPSVIACSGPAGHSVRDASPLPIAQEPPIDPADVSMSPDAGASPHVVELSAAGDITFALYSDGTVSSWGAATDPGAEAEPVSLTLDGKIEHDVPTMVPGLTGVRQISTGSSHTCVVGQDGVARCWGVVLRGSLGPGIVHNQREPTPIADGQGVAEIEARGRMCLRYETGEARCLGYDTADIRPIASLGSVERLSANFVRGCAVRTNGTAACWGSVFGRDHPYGTYWNVPMPDRPDLWHADAVAVRGLAQVRALALMADHVCAIANGNQLYCWGVGGNGELGTGKSSDGNDPTAYQELSPTKVPDLPPVEAVTAGSHFTCAVTTAGKAMCWGANGAGQLGVGDTKQRLRATEVPEIDGLVQIAAGDFHVCALRSDGAVFCWGCNEDGQVGIGTSGHRRCGYEPSNIVLTPTAVAALAH
jgi:alpha-tubulin suppressor-like RCC1 family protein